MINEFIDTVAARIREAFGSVFNLDWLPEIFFWYWWLFLLFLICGAIIWFFGWSKIVRIVASMSFAFAAVFVAGGAVMARRLKAREQARAKPPMPPSPEPDAPRWNWPWGT